MVDPPDPTIGASFKPDMFPIAFVNQPNPISSFLKNLTITPPLPTVNTICEPKSSESSDFDLSLTLMMHEPMQEEPRVEDPVEPPQNINTTQPW